MKFNYAMRIVSIFFLKLVFVWPFKLIIKLVDYIKDRQYDVDMSDYPDDDEEIEEKQKRPRKNAEISIENDATQSQDSPSKYDNLPEIPEMCQIFPLDDNTCIGVQFVDMCPDETAHIRVIGDTTFSQIYKKRVLREKTYGRERYFMLNGEKYYLRPETTQPIEPVQAKEGK
jgi:hypothetical protein